MELIIFVFSMHFSLPSPLLSFPTRRRQTSPSHSLPIGHISMSGVSFGKLLAPFDQFTLTRRIEATMQNAIMSAGNDTEAQNPLVDLACFVIAPCEEVCSDLQGRESLLCKNMSIVTLEANWLLREYCRL